LLQLAINTEPALRCGLARQVHTKFIMFSRRKCCCNNEEIHFFSWSKLSPCSECCMIPSGWFFGVWIYMPPFRNTLLHVNRRVGICSIFVGGWIWRILHTYPLMKMEQCSETLANVNSDAWNPPEDSIIFFNQPRHLRGGDSWLQFVWTLKFGCDGGYKVGKLIEFDSFAAHRMALGVYFWYHDPALWLLQLKLSSVATGCIRVFCVLTGMTPSCFSSVFRVVCAC